MIKEQHAVIRINTRPECDVLQCSNVNRDIINFSQQSSVA